MMKRSLLNIILLLFPVQLLNARVDLPQFFADNMVLQSNTNVAIWGTAEPEVEVSISATWLREKVRTVSDAEGKWFVTVPTYKPGGPYKITIFDGDKCVLENVLIGEVWICSGQSNMSMRMSGFTGQPVNGSVNAIQDADHRIPIRSCNLEWAVAASLQNKCGAQWSVNDSEGVSKASAVGYFFALKMYEALKVPIGIINVSRGGTPIEAWMDPEILNSEFAGEFDLTHLADGKQLNEKLPGVLYNGMLHPLAPYTVKGFLWYQGCQNRKRYSQYERLQPAFVRMLRNKWNNDRLPFYFTQIAPYRYENPEKSEGGYMMWSQAKTLLQIPYSGMATTHDIGEYSCIHPANKKTVGERLAYLALEHDYGFKKIDSKTPIPIGFEFSPSQAIVTFDRCESFLNLDIDDVTGFELAGEDKVFYPAEVSLIEGKNQIKVYDCPQVQTPVAVRYGMRNWSEATLFNGFGIPVSPFRSDDWE